MRGATSGNRGLTEVIHGVFRRPFAVVGNDGRGIIKIAEVEPAAAELADTSGSALTGRHPPAAREHSHLFGLSRVRFAPSFSLVSAGYRRFMKGGRNDPFEVPQVPPGSPVSRSPPQTGKEARARHRRR